MPQRTPFEDQCSITIPATVHGFTTPDLRVQVADTPSCGYALQDVDPRYVHINPSSYDVTITLPIADLSGSIAFCATESSDHTAITFRVVAMGEVVITPARTDAS
jgi:hypothetical protein